MELILLARGGGAGARVGGVCLKTRGGRGMPRRAEGGGSEPGSGVGVGGVEARSQKVERREWVAFYRFCFFLYANQ